jgi:hypothetical protein
MGAENRRQERVKGYAKVLYPPAMTPGYLRDLSPTGCQVSFLQKVPAAAGEVIPITIVPGTEAATPGVSVSLRVRWTRADGLYFSIGGEVEQLTAAEDREKFAALVSYYEGYQ